METILNLHYWCYSHCMANLYRLNSFLIIETQKSLYKFTIENIILFKFTLSKRCYSTISFTVAGCVQEPAGQANTSPRLPGEGGTWGNVDGLSEKPEAPELDGESWACVQNRFSPLMTSWGFPITGLDLYLCILTRNQPCPNALELIFKYDLIGVITPVLGREHEVAPPKITILFISRVLLLLS